MAQDKTGCASEASGAAIALLGHTLYLTCLDSYFVWLSAVAFELRPIATAGEGVEHPGVAPELWNLFGWHRAGRRGKSQKLDVLRDGLAEGVLSNEPPFVLDSTWDRLARAKVNWEQLQLYERAFWNEQQRLTEEPQNHRVSFRVVKAADRSAPLRLVQRESLRAEEPASSSVEPVQHRLLQATSKAASRPESTSRTPRRAEPSGHHFAAVICDLTLATGVFKCVNSNWEDQGLSFDFRDSCVVAIDYHQVLDRARCGRTEWDYEGICHDNLEAIRQLKAAFFREGIHVVTICLSYLHSQERRDALVAAFNRTPDISSVFDFIVTTSERASFNPRTQKGGKVLVLQDLLSVGFRSAFIVDDSDEVINSIIDRQVQDKISGIHIKLRRKPTSSRMHVQCMRTWLNVS